MTTAVVSEPIPPPAIAGLFPPRARAVIYVLTVMLSAAYAVIVASVDLHWGWQAAYAAWNALAGALAVSNTSAAATVVGGPAPAVAD